MKDIKEVTAMLFDLEKANYVMRKTIDGIQRELNALPTPVKPEYHEPNIHEYCSGYLYEGIEFGIKGLISSPIVTIILWVLGRTEHFFRTLFVLAPILCILGVVLGLLFAACTESSNRRFHDNYNRRLLKEAKDEYNEAMLEYRKTCNEIEPKRKNLINQKRKLNNLLYTSEKTLLQLYNRYGIISDFRNLVSTGYMYKLAEMGASSSFTGENGLFYLTYKELRADRLEEVIGTVGDNIVSSLYGIIRTRSHYLYRDISLCDSRSSNFIKGAEYNMNALEDFIEERQAKARGYLA